MKSGKVELSSKDYKDTLKVDEAEEVLEEELTKVLAHNYIDDYDFDYDEDYDYDYEEEEYEEETYVIDTPVVSSNKNFTSMLKEGSSVNGTSATDYYNCKNSRNYF